MNSHEYESIEWEFDEALKRKIYFSFSLEILSNIPVNFSHLLSF